MNQDPPDKPTGSGCQPIGSLMNGILPIASNADSTSPAPPKTSGTTGLPKADSAPASSTGLLPGGAGAALLRSVREAGNVDTALRLMKDSWPPRLRRLIETTQVKAKLIHRFGKDKEPLESFCEQTVPLDIWLPEPIDAAEADLVRASLQVCNKALVQAAVDGLLETVTRLLLPYGYLPKSGYDKQVLLDQWQAHLRGFPLWAVQQVCWEWQRHNGEAPRISDIVGRVEVKVRPVAGKAHRLKTLIKAAEEGRFYQYVIDGANLRWEEVDREGKPRPRVLPADEHYAAG